MGAAGRDFHNFLVYFKKHPEYEVVAFTAEQIPGIAGRKFPAVLGGKQYPNGIPIYPEDQLESLIQKHTVDIATLAYSDLKHVDVMHKASRILAAGVDFMLLGPNSTMVKSIKPVISVCAVRTGCGKSQTSRFIADYLKELGLRVAVIRHPMPYGDLAEQAVERFATYDDLKKFKCTIEEREEYEPHLAEGHIVYAGVDYEAILRQAEQEVDVILWDGGNNDFSFYVPDLSIAVVDPLRVGHESLYYPGETVARMADIVVINKVNTARFSDVQTLQNNITLLNPRAAIVQAASTVIVDDPSLIQGKNVLVVEDGPTLTHGGMEFGAGEVAAKQYGAKSMVEAKPFAVGSIKATYAKYTQIHTILPAMGYSKQQIRELEETINAAKCDSVVIGTPINLGKLLKINKPYTRVSYDLTPHDPEIIKKAVRKVVQK